MITIHQDAWVPFPGKGAGWTARIHCSECERAFMLTEYNIDDTGIVSPSVVCPHCAESNGKLRLAAWPPEILT